MRALATVCCKASLGAALLVRACSGCGGCGGMTTPTEVVLVTHDSFAISDDVRSGVRGDERPRAADPPVGRRGRARVQGAPHRGEPAGRRPLRRRQHLPLARSRGRSVRAVRVAAPRPAWTQRYVLDPEHRVTPIDHGDVCLNYDKEWFASRQIAPPRSLDDLADARSRASSSSRTRPPPLRGSRSSSRRSRATASRAGRTSGARCARTASSSSTAGRRRTTSRFSGAAGERQPADRRLLRVEPAGGGDLRRRRARRGPDGGRRGQLLPPDRVRGRPPGSAERGGRARARRLHALEALPGGHPALDVRLPGRTETPSCRPSSCSTRSSPRTRSSCRPTRSRRIATGG